MTTADAVYASHVVVLEGVAELAQVGVGRQHLVGAEGAVKASIARERSASETPGGRGCVETTSAWLMTLLLSGNLI